MMHEEQVLFHRQPSRPSTANRPRAHRASGPCEVLSWDITYLRSPIQGVFYYLYLIEDIWSRKIVGWAVHDNESMGHASRLIDATAAQLDRDPTGMVLHSDNGSPKKGSTMLTTLQRLGIAPSFSRPRISDDNPYSESPFRTLKYRPAYPPGPFNDLDAARDWVADFGARYNVVAGTVRTLTRGHHARASDTSAPMLTSHAPNPVLGASKENTGCFSYTQEHILASRLLLVVLCVAVGFAAGTFWTGFTKDTGRNHPKGSHTLPASTIETGTRDAGPQISQSQTNVNVQNASRGIPAVRDLAETADISSEFLQSAALYLLAAPRDAAGIRQLLEDARDALTGGDYRGATSLLIGRFAELDFPQALDYALENGGQFRASWLQAIFHARARIDVEDALASAQELTNSQQQIAGLAMLRSNHHLTASQRRSIASGLMIPAHMVASSQPGTAEAWEDLRNIADPMQRASAQAQILMNWARSDPWAALDASAEMQSAQMSSAMQARLLGLAAADDPQRALDWLNTQPEGQQRDQLTAAVATQLAASDPEQAQALLQGLPAEARMQGELGLWSQRAVADPEGAAAWVAGLSNNDDGILANMQWRMAPMQLLSVLGMTSAESADRFMNALPAEQSNQLESTYVQVLAQRDPTTAASRISGISDEQQRQNASSSLVQVWGRSDPQQASRWVEQQSGETTAELYQALGSSWSQRDANSARDYAEGMRSGINRDHMYSGILSSGRVPPNEFEAMAKQIDNQQLRAQAKQMQTLIRQSMSGALTSAPMSSLQIMSDTSTLSNMSSRRVISVTKDVNEDTGKNPPGK